MKRFVEGTDRGQTTLFPECLEDWIDENNPVRVIDAFVDKLDLSGLTPDKIYTFPPRDLLVCSQSACGR
jgi:transposase